MPKVITKVEVWYRILWCGVYMKGPDKGSGSVKDIAP
jgi:hypothetical protein